MVLRISRACRHGCVVKPNILAVSLRAIRVKVAGISDYAPFVVRLEIFALGVLMSMQRDMDYILVNAHEV